VAPARGRQQRPRVLVRLRRPPPGMRLRFSFAPPVFYRWIPSHTANNVLASSHAYAVHLQVKVVHLGQSTCHGISGRGGSSGMRLGLSCVPEKG